MAVLKAIKALWSIRNEHRNYVWENKVYDAYPLAFKLPPWDIAYIKMMEGIKLSFLEKMLFKFNAKKVIKAGDKSSRMILFLQLSDLKSPLLNEIPVVEWINDYFEEGHPFRRS